MLQELLYATVAMTALSAILVAVYWFFTGMSPWPFVVFGEAVGASLGIILLLLSHPRRSR